MAENSFRIGEGGVRISLLYMFDICMIQVWSFTYEFFFIFLLVRQGTSPPVAGYPGGKRGWTTAVRRTGRPQNRGATAGRQPLTIISGFQTKSQKMRLLIAESGATKTDWAWIQNGKPVYLSSSGLHPAYLDLKQTAVELKQILRAVDPVRILFYGAGCYSEEACTPVRQLLEEVFGSVPIEFHDDLAAIAHAFLGKEEGVAGILGTGSNSGLFRGGRNIQQVPALGYILGDEGSAADIGKRILRTALREELSAPAMAFVRSRLGGLEYPVVIRKLYNSGRPSYYLARIAERVIEKEMPEELRLLIEESFQAYVDAHL